MTRTGAYALVSLARSLADARRAIREAEDCLATCPAGAMPAQVGGYIGLASERLRAAAEALGPALDRAADELSVPARDIIRMPGLEDVTE